jgi:hypothetical protein
MRGDTGITSPYPRVVMVAKLKYKKTVWSLENPDCRPGRGIGKGSDFVNEGKDRSHDE